MLYMKHIALFLLFLVGWMCVSCSEEKEQVVMPALVEIRGEKRCVSKFGRSENI